MATPNKRRIVDEPSVPNTAISAITALAARRRLAGGTSSGAETPPLSDEVEFTTTQSNAFDALRSLKQQDRDSPAGSHGGSNKPQDVQRNPTRSGIDVVGNASDAIDIQVPLRQIQYSSFVLSKSNYRLKDGGISELRLNNERFLILGSFGIKIYSGEVTVAGAVFAPSNQIRWIHAPHSHAIPVLRTAEKTRIEILPHPDAKELRMLGEISPLFQKLWNESSGDEDSSTYQILCSQDNAPKKSILQDLVSPPQWNKELATLLAASQRSKSFSALLCGPKSSGKSTFSKILINHLLTNGKEDSGIAVLDMDPGQPEYTPSGMISLIHVRTPNLGTPFTHPGSELQDFHVIRSHTIASVTPADAAELYLECITDLFGCYSNGLSNIPLIINTPGWILGTGLDLLVSTIETCRPSNVIYMSEDGPVESVEALRQATKESFSALPSQPSEFSPRTAAQLRAMQMMSYFHKSNPETGGQGSWFHQPLSSIRPLQIRYSGSPQGIMGIVSYHHETTPELLSAAIDGMVLAVVVIESKEAFRGLITADDGVSRTPEGIPFIPNPEDISLDPRLSRSLGLILVRSVDTKNKFLNILTPIQLKDIENTASLKQSLVLVRGKFDTPTWAYTEDLYRNENQVSNKDGKKQHSDESEGTGKQNPNNPVHPWVEVLKPNQGRAKGSKVWRVRRDLGKGD